LIVVGLVCWFFWPARDPVRERFDLISTGWTRKDVIEVMGQPEIEAAVSNEGTVLCFSGADGTADIFICDKTNLVTRKRWTRPEGDPVWLRLWHRLATSLGI
jgi:hypothetical protein